MKAVADRGANCAWMHSVGTAAESEAVDATGGWKVLNESDKAFSLQEGVRVVRKVSALRLRNPGVNDDDYGGGGNAVYHPVADEAFGGTAITSLLNLIKRYPDSNQVVGQAASALDKALSQLTPVAAGHIQLWRHVSRLMHADTSANFQPLMMSTLIKFAILPYKPACTPQQAAQKEAALRVFKILARDPDVLSHVNQSITCQQSNDSALVTLIMTSLREDSQSHPPCKISSAPEILQVLASGYNDRMRMLVAFSGDMEGMGEECIDLFRSAFAVAEDQRDEQQRKAEENISHAVHRNSVKPDKKRLSKPQWLPRPFQVCKHGIQKRICYECSMGVRTTTSLCNEPNCKCPEHTVILRWT